MTNEDVGSSKHEEASGAEAVDNVESTIHELGNIFTQLATMVSQQGELAIRITGHWSVSTGVDVDYASHIQTINGLVKNGAKKKPLIFVFYTDGRDGVLTVAACGKPRLIRRCRYNLTPAESKFKTPMLDRQDKNMMKAQVHVSRSSAISDVQTLPQKKLYRQNIKAYIEGEIVSKLSRS
nr:putative syntaxin [Tanacetum cinerariifolium]